MASGQAGDATTPEDTGASSGSSAGLRWTGNEGVKRDELALNERVRAFAADVLATGIRVAKGDFQVFGIEVPDGCILPDGWFVIIVNNLGRNFTGYLEGAGRWNPGGQGWARDPEDLVDMTADEIPTGRLFEGLFPEFLREIQTTAFPSLRHLQAPLCSPVPLPDSGIRTFSSAPGVSSRVETQTEPSCPKMERGGEFSGGIWMVTLSKEGDGKVGCYVGKANEFIGRLFTRCGGPVAAGGLRAARGSAGSPGRVGVVRDRGAGTPGGGWRPWGPAGGAGSPGGDAGGHRPAASCEKDGCPGGASGDGGIVFLRRWPASLNHELVQQESDGATDGTADQETGPEPSREFPENRRRADGQRTPWIAAAWSALTGCAAVFALVAWLHRDAAGLAACVVVTVASACAALAGMPGPREGSGSDRGTEF